MATSCVMTVDNYWFDDDDSDTDSFKSAQSHLDATVSCLVVFKLRWELSHVELVVAHSE